MWAGSLVLAHLALTLIVLRTRSRKYGALCWLRFPLALAILDVYPTSRTSTNDAGAASYPCLGWGIVQRESSGIATEVNQSWAQHSFSEAKLEIEMLI